MAVERSGATKSVRSRQNVALIAPLLVLAAWRFATRRYAPPSAGDMGLDVAGMLLLLAGLWLRVYARQWKAEQSHDGLVTNGLYRAIRHPLYVGSFLLGLGLCAVVGDGVLTAAFLAAFWLNHGLVIRREERELEDLFGQEYREYQRRVPAFIPSLRGPGLRSLAAVRPRRLREGLAREGDAVCLWLAIPLLVSLAECLIGGTGDDRSRPLVLLAGIAGLTALWLRLKLDYRALIRTERQRPFIQRKAA